MRTHRFTFNVALVSVAAALVSALGACTSSPPETQSCSNNTTSCPGNSICVDLHSDPSNCGTCNKACSAGQVCSLGQCAGSCLGDTKLCGGRCADLKNDPANCGTCGAACAQGDFCVSGACSSTCGALTTCGDYCVDTNSDPTHCGSCDKTCASSEVCSNGTCTTSNIKHVVLIVEENHTFDSYFGKYCTAQTGSNPTCTTGPGCCEAAPEVDPSGASPITLDDNTNYAYDRNHDQVCERTEIDNGNMDHFVTGSNISGCSKAGNWALADQSTVGTYWQYAGNGALGDRYFQPLVGGTSSNDMYFAVAHYQFVDNQDRPSTIGSGCTSPLPSTVVSWTGVTTVADLLVGAGFSFAMYADGYLDAVAASPHCPTTVGLYPPDCPTSQTLLPYSPCNYDPSDLPFEFYAQFADVNLVDSSQFASDVANNNLPNFAYVKARTSHNEHPDYSTITRGASFVSSIVDAIESSPYKDDTLILLTWDEGGGFFDHVPPPGPVPVAADKDSNNVQVPYGTRVPMIAIGKFARVNTISHVQMEHSSVVRFLEYNFLGANYAGALGNRDSVVNNIGSLLDPAATGVIIPEGN